MECVSDNTRPPSVACQRSDLPIAGNLTSWNLPHNFVDALEAVEKQRLAAEAELDTMPKRGRPSKRKHELLEFLASIAGTTQAETSDQQRKAAEAELAAMPNRGRPSKRKQELIAFLSGMSGTLSPKEAAPKKKGRPRKEQLSSEHQEILNQLEDRAKAIKGAKHALGHNPENCSEYQADKIKLIENEYPDLYRAYQLKESLRLIPMCVIPIFFEFLTVAQGVRQSNGLLGAVQK